MGRIMIVEDDFCLRRDITEILEGQEEVVAVSSYQSALQYVLNGKPIDLYLIDVMLPDGDGFLLCRKIRERNQNPIIFLTACSDEESIVAGFDMGADDYVTKPFRMRELLARVQANLRRPKINQTNRLYSGSLVLDLPKETVSCRGELLKLSETEYELLCLFLKNPGVLLRRERILASLWEESGKFVEDNTLSVTVSRLRRKIKDFEETPYWEVVWGMGYRYLLSVQHFGAE